MLIYFKRVFTLQSQLKPLSLFFYYTVLFYLQLLVLFIDGKLGEGMTLSLLLFFAVYLIPGTQHVSFFFCFFLEFFFRGRFEARLDVVRIFPVIKVNPFNFLQKSFQLGVAQFVQVKLEPKPLLHHIMHLCQSNSSIFVFPQQLHKFLF